MVAAVSKLHLTYHAWGYPSFPGRLCSTLVLVLELIENQPTICCLSRIDRMRSVGDMSRLPPTAQNYANISRILFVTRVCAVATGQQSHDRVPAHAPSGKIFFLRCLLSF